MAANLSTISQGLLTGLIVCASIANFGLFKKAKIEVGFHLYAERVDPTTALKMPFNALVNCGYALVGIYWLFKVRKCKRKLSDEDVYFFDVFSVMSILYAPVQLLRIVTQNRLFAILDQWVTLPIFAWASIWGMYVTKPESNFGMEIPFLCLSIISYCATILSDVGFEIALGLNIICAILIAANCQTKRGTNASMKCMLLAILSCIGFVLLKINDENLGKRHWMFKRISGHFLSKICDVMQIDLVAQFFFEICHNRTHRKSK